MSPVLSDRLMTVLVELEELWRPTREKFTVAEVGHRSHVKIIHHAITREWAMTHPAHHHLTIADVEDIERAGMIDVDWTHGRDGRRGDARLTVAGEREVDRVRSPPPTPATPVGSNWQADIRPALEAAYALEQSLAPDVGVTQDELNIALGRARGDAATTIALMQLSAAGYLRDELSNDQIDGPIMFRLGEKALQQLAGWPGAGGDLSTQLLALIDQRAADPEVSEEERGRLVRLRDTIGDVGKSVVTELLAALIKSQTGI